MKDGRLEVSDLMTGDWCTSPDLNNKPAYWTGDIEYYKKQVEGKTVWYKRYMFLYSGGGEGAMVPDSRIFPIPLTKEILEKIGFVNDYYEEGCVADYGYIKHDGYTLTYKNEEVDAIITWCNGCVSITTEHGDDVQITIKYLHELQHALKLCKIEKPIEL
jgi:hypothetical protein